MSENDRIRSEILRARELASYFAGRADALEEVEAARPLAESPETTNRTRNNLPQALATPGRGQPQRAVLEVLRRNSDRPLMVGEIIRLANALGFDIRREQVRDVLTRVQGYGWIVREGARYRVVQDFLTSIIQDLQGSGE